MITREQLRAAGLTDAAVARMVSRGQLSRRARSVYSVGPSRRTSAPSAARARRDHCDALTGALVASVAQTLARAA